MGVCVPVAVWMNERVCGSIVMLTIWKNAKKCRVALKVPRPDCSQYRGMINDLVTVNQYAESCPMLHKLSCMFAVLSSVLFPWPTTLISACS